MLFRGKCDKGKVPLGVGNAALGVAPGEFCTKFKFMSGAKSVFASSHPSDASMLLAKAARIVARMVVGLRGRGHV
jgi:hypothetical protein